MSYSNGNGHGGNRGGGGGGIFGIDLGALLLAGFVAMCFAIGTGEDEMPNLRDGQVDPSHQDGGGEPSAPADTCTTEEALAVIAATGLTVIEWQTQEGIVADGVVGPQTRAAACG